MKQTRCRHDQNTMQTRFRTDGVRTAGDGTDEIGTTGWPLNSDLGNLGFVFFVFFFDFVFFGV